MIVLRTFTLIYRCRIRDLHGPFKLKVEEVKQAMKRQLIKLVGMGAVAAGIIFAQTQAPAPTAQANQNKPAVNHRAAARHRMFQELNLTPAQKEHAKTIFQQASVAAKPVRDQLRQNREAMAAAVKADNQAQIAQLSATRGKLMGEITTTRSEAMARFYHELTPAQRAKADQIIAG
jgi:Spy/CpxP family protein refolding chaperone